MKCMPIQYMENVHQIHEDLWLRFHCELEFVKKKIVNFNPFLYVPTFQENAWNLSFLSVPAVLNSRKQWNDVNKGGIFMYFGLVEG